MTKSDYVWVVGHGSSGTKRVFYLFDLSAQTHCRMAHERAVGTPFEQLPCYWALGGADSKELDGKWDDAVAWAATHFSRIDLLPPPPKDHLYPLARHLRLWRLVSGPRGRRVTGFFLPSLRQMEWPLPWWLGDGRSLSRAKLVMKTNQVPSWVKWVLENRPAALVVHVVRHPGAYLNAWHARYVNGRCPKHLLRQNCARLRRIIETAPEWDVMFGDIDGMSLDESELWFWCYTCQTIFEAGRQSDNYVLVKDEEVVEDPWNVARKLYQKSGLKWSESLERWLDAQPPKWRARTRPWRELLSSRDVQTVDRILDSTVMRDWWRRDQIVSLFDYQAFEL